MRISDWSSDVCSSDLPGRHLPAQVRVDVGQHLKLTFLDGLLVDLPQLEGESLDHMGQIGRASCRERVCQSVSISVGDVSLNQKSKTTNSKQLLHLYTI